MNIYESSSLSDDQLPLPVAQYLHGFDVHLRTLPEIDRQLVVRGVRDGIVAQIETAPPTLMALFDRLGSPDRNARAFVLYHDLSTYVRRPDPRRLLVVMMLFAPESLMAFGAVMAALALFIVALGGMVLALWITGPGVAVGWSSLYFMTSAHYLILVLAGLYAVLCVGLGTRILQRVGRVMLRCSQALPTTWR